MEVKYVRLVLKAILNLIINKIKTKIKIRIQRKLLLIAVQKRVKDFSL